MITFSESMLDRVKKEFEPYLKEIPSKFNYEVTINGVNVTSKKGTFLGNIGLMRLRKKGEWKKFLREIEKVSKMKPKKQGVMNLGDLDWDKHGDGY
jgi:hypothetical protein